MYGKVELWCLNTEQLCCGSEQEAQYPWDIWWGLEQAEHTGVCLGCCVLMGKNDRSCMIIRYNNKLLYNSWGKAASANTILRISFSDTWKQAYQLMDCQCLFQSCLNFLLWCVCSDYWWDVSALIWTVTVCKLGLIRFLAIIIPATVGMPSQDRFCRA